VLKSQPIKPLAMGWIDRIRFPVGNLAPD